MAEEFDDADFLAAVNAADRSGTAGRSGPSSDGPTRVVQPKPQALPQRQGPSAILVSTRQKGNPILNHVKSLPWEYSDIPCDYVLGATTCALFLSLKYHRLHPEYIYSRLRALGKLYNLRILLTMVDINNHEEALKELSKTSMINNLTVVLCWSAQEAGRYLELFKSYEHASADSMRAHQARNYEDSLVEFVTTPRNINKTDANSLISNFGSLRAAVNAEPEELAYVPGWGEKKVKAWCNAVREPFRVKRAERTNVGLYREATSMTDGGSGSDHSRGVTPVPISSVPSLKHSNTTPTMSRENTRPEGSNKRPRLQEISPDDDDADAMAEIENTNGSSSHADRAKEKPNEPVLASGVAAALARLRDNS
ncbi:Mating-type switching protein swi10 [Cyphellophora attinorum]|uniref:Mating-type switching protein swi10 n=1 Tax=Cyphellophora attinorum TaxID=1664694 RepID=A0A0N0NP06_9EURO|nr:Mating-type switching protein swi10 [Phialophora attinorum]KPI42158.1 Mating-type switching protein swi10 [Phialophora attinorum]